MIKKFRYGVVGCGAAGKVHAFHFSLHPAIEPVFCVDPEETRAGEFRGLFGFPFSFGTLTEALDSQAVDILSIATPPIFHAEQIRAASARGIHILCEKPLVIRPEEVPVLESCREKGISLGVMLPRRFYRNSLATREALEKKRLGTIRRVSFTLEVQKDRDYYDGWRGQKRFAGGGVLMSQAIHSIDQLVFLFGPPVEVRGRIWRVRDFIDVEDEAEATLRFENQVEVSLRASNNSKRHLWKGLTEIEGSQGRIVLDSEKTPVWEVPEMERPLEEEPEEIPSSLKPFYFGPSHGKVIGNFIASLAGIEKLRASGENSLDAMRIIWELYRENGAIAKAR